MGTAAGRSTSFTKNRVATAAYMGGRIVTESEPAFAVNLDSMAKEAGGIVTFPAAAFRIVATNTGKYFLGAANLPGWIVRTDSTFPLKENEMIAKV